MQRAIVIFAVVAATAMVSAQADAQTYGTPTVRLSTNPTGPALSEIYFKTLLEKDPSRDVQLQMQTHAPNRPGNGFHSHNGDQWEVVVEGEITFTAKGQPSHVLKAGESVYIPRGTVHRNENKSNAPARTIELLIKDKDKPQSNPAPAG
jgi:quercetin dioxygenase-like cupin family protein